MPPGREPEPTLRFPSSRSSRARIPASFPESVSSSHTRVVTDSSEDSFALLARHQAGDPHALNALLQRHYARVERIVRVRLRAAGDARADSSDLVQQTMIKALQHIDRFQQREDARLIDWLARIAEREVLAHHRRQAAACRDVHREQVAQRPTDGSSSESPIHQALAGDSTPSQQAARGEDKELLDECLAGLPEDLREVILLRDFAGASWSHVATQLGKPSSDAARKQHERALAALREAVRRRLGQSGR